MIVATIDPGLVALIGILLGGGGIGAFVAFRKAGPEVESISVKTMKDVIEELRAERVHFVEEIERLRALVGKLEGVAQENEALRHRLERLEKIADHGSE